LEFFIEAPSGCLVAFSLVETVGAGKVGAAVDDAGDGSMGAQPGLRVRQQARRYPGSSSTMRIRVHDEGMPASAVFRDGAGKPDRGVVQSGMALWLSI